MGIQASEAYEFLDGQRRISAYERHLLLYAVCNWVSKVLLHAGDPTAEARREKLWHGLVRCIRTHQNSEQARKEYDEADRELRDARAYLEEFILDSDELDGLLGNDPQES